MDTGESLARRIRTAEDVHGIVRTMKAVAAASVRPYERCLAAAERSEHVVELGLSAVLREVPLGVVSRGMASLQTLLPEMVAAAGAGVDTRSGPAASGPSAGVVALGHESDAVRTHEVPDEGRLALVLLGSDQGLCGAFNDLVIRGVQEDLADERLDTGAAAVLTVGARAADRLTAIGLRSALELPCVASAPMLPSLAEQILLVIDTWQRSGPLTGVVVYTARPVSGTRCEPVREVLLPVPTDRLIALREAAWPTRMLPRRTLPRGRLIAELAHQGLMASLVRLLAWSALSEHTSRLMAMQAAERTIEERLDELRAAYHHRRQTEITTELLDIVAGAEAVAAVG